MRGVACKTWIHTGKERGCWRQESWGRAEARGHVAREKPTAKAEASLKICKPVVL